MVESSMLASHYQKRRHLRMELCKMISQQSMMMAMRRKYSSNLSLVQYRQALLVAFRMFWIRTILAGVQPPREEATEVATLPIQLLYDRQLED